MSRVQTVAAAQSPGPGATGEDAVALAVDLRRLRELLDDGHVEAARHFIKELEPRWPDSERVRHYAHVLAPPVVRLRPDIRGRSRDREFAWLKQHGHEYPGRWLALFEDRLIAADPDRRVVIAKVRKELGQESALLYYQPLPRQSE